MKRIAAALMVLATVWVVTAQGVVLEPTVAVVTAVMIGVLAAVTLAGGIRFHPVHGWLAALLGWAATAAVILPVPRAHAAWLVAVGLTALLLLLVLAAPRTAPWGTASALAMGALSAAWLLGERVFTGGRPGGPVDDPNRAATAAVIALAVLPALKLPAAARIASGALLLSGVVASGSRAALIAVAVVSVAVVAARLPRRSRSFLGLVCGVALFALALRIALDRDPLRFERLRIWRVAALCTAAELPFGAGPGGYRDAALRHNFPRDGEFARYHRIPSLAENDALQLAAGLGAPGLALGIGLAVALASAARRRPALIPVLAAVATTSAFHSQLTVPLVAWSAALAIGGLLPRGQPPQCRLKLPVLVAIVPLVAASLGAALGWPTAGPFEESAPLVAKADAILVAAPEDPLALAGAETIARRATSLRPRHPEAWRKLGDVRSRRAWLLGDPHLALAAVEAYAEAARLNPLDVWAALGEGRAQALLDDRRRAASLFRAAIALEPNCVPAWLELARAQLEIGEIAAARASLTQGEVALRRGRPASFVSGYEWAMVTPDPVLLLRLREALGEVR